MGDYRGFPSEHFGKMALTLLKNATKLAIGGGAVYWTYEQGVWNSNAESKEFGKKIIPQENIDLWKQAINEITTACADTWNKGMQDMFRSEKHVKDLSPYSGRTK